jgi:hypothetical protein
LTPTVQAGNVAGPGKKGKKKKRKANKKDGSKKGMMKARPSSRQSGLAVLPEASF